MGKRMKVSIAFLMSLVLLACSATMDVVGEEKAIREVMAQQEKAWNEGDLEGFMQGYWKSDSLLFIGSSTQYGWQQTLDNYKKSYPTKDNMGILQFDILEVKILSESSAHVVGKWQLSREKLIDLNGYYTLLWEKIGGKWVIVTDHSS